MTMYLSFLLASDGSDSTLLDVYNSQSNGARRDQRGNQK